MLRRCILFFFLLLPMGLYAGTTGKIAGRVIDKETNEPLPGVNVIVEGTNFGAATNLNGEYVILNIPPGVYTVSAQMIGYQKVRKVQVKVTIDLTTRVNFALGSKVLNLDQEITVVAERPFVRKDVTSSHAIVSAEDIQQLPVENFGQILELQAGVVQGAGGEIHIRGGRSGEVVYMVDGISVTDPYNSGLALSIENEAIQEMEFISGTFNAEYGQAMSGVVNIVTKEGSRAYHGQIISYIGDYYSTHTDVFEHIDEIDPLSIKDVRLNFSGPVPLTKNKVTFFTSGRYYNSEGYLYGKAVYAPSDSNDFNKPPETWQATGDGKIVAMNPYRKQSGQWKFAYNLTNNIKITLGGLADWSRGQSYSHKWKYTPGGRPTWWGWGYNTMLTLTHTLSPRTFYTFRYSNFFNAGKSYVYEDPLDPRYVSAERLNTSSGYRFYAGGVNLGRSFRHTLNHIYKLDITSQINNTHQLKSGFQYEWTKLFGDNYTIQVDQSTNWKPKIPDIALAAHDRYVRRPRLFSYYLQDKIELVDMIVNVGVRFEYFDPNSVVPADPADPSIWASNKHVLAWAVTNSDTVAVHIPYRLDPETKARTYIDPNTGEPLGEYVSDGYLTSAVGGRHIKFNGKTRIIDPNTGGSLEQGGNLSWYKKASPKYQISPRIGIAFPITDRGVIHFSYGHFLQIPNYSYLYANPEFEVTPGLSATMGNADLEPQRTVSYEIGLQQQISEDIGINVTGFYKDVRNLLGVQIIKTYAAGDRYALYINRDYGNIRGITFSVDKRYSNYISGKLDYTFSVAEGNASDPEASFYDAINDVEPEKQLVYLDWDQRHTLNASVTIGRPGNWNVSFVSQLGSGLPYTPQFRGIRTAFENAGRKPFRFNLDMRLNKIIILNGMRIGFYMSVYNLLDRKNEDFVYSDTGRATYSLIPTYTPNPPGPFNLLEYLIRPDFYSAPREIRIGMSVGF